MGEVVIVVDVSAIIKNKDLYRVKSIALGEKYIKEVFDDNDTLHEETVSYNR